MKRHDTRSCLLNVSGKARRFKPTLELSTKNRRCKNSVGQKILCVVEFNSLSFQTSSGKEYLRQRYRCTIPKDSFRLQDWYNQSMRMSQLGRIDTEAWVDKPVTIFVRVRSNRTVCMQNVQVLAVVGEHVTCILTVLNCCTEIALGKR